MVAPIHVSALHFHLQGVFLVHSASNGRQNEHFKMKNKYIIIIIIIVTQYCAGGQIEKNEMGRTCGAYGGGKRGAQGVGGET
jgi:hypothetical protein